MKNTRNHQILLNDLHNTILDFLPDGYPLLSETAGQLGISTRTLQRRLAEAGLSYSNVVEEVRYAQACQGLGQSRGTVADLARQLGYRDPGSFSRAFTRWTGMAPRSYRRKFRV